MADWTAPYTEQIDDCEARESRLTEWEIDFLDSMRKQLERAQRPTQKQTDVLDRVWEKATERG